MLPASSHLSSWNFSEPRRNFPSRKSCPHQDRKSRVKEQLPQLLGYRTKVPLSEASKKWRWSGFNLQQAQQVLSLKRPMVSPLQIPSASDSLELPESLPAPSMFNITIRKMQMKTRCNITSHLLEWLSSKRQQIGLLWWLSGKDSICQFGWQGFSPWSRKIAHAVEQLSPWAATIELVL